MNSIYRNVRYAILLTIAAGMLLPAPTRAAEYFGQASAQVKITDADGGALPAGSIETTFVEATPFTDTTGSSVSFANADVSTDAGNGFIDGFGAVLGVAGASDGAAAQAGARWIGGVLVNSTSALTVLADISFFSAVAGAVAVPEELASAGVTLDLVFGTVYADCIPGSGSTVQDIDLDCFDIIVRIPLDDQDGVALPNFLIHTTLTGHESAHLVANVVEGTPGSPVPLTSGAEQRASIGISAGVPVLVGIEATAAGSAAHTGQPRCFGAVATIIGTDGDDAIRGTARDDVILSLGGDDVISGKAGDDLICGGDGDDRIVGHKDDDKIAGEGGNDKIDGYYGDDYITSGPGNDFVQGCDGEDVIDGGPGNDTLRGERGNDLILGGTGNDNIKGAAGRDIVIGGQDVVIDVSIALNGFAPIAFKTATEGDSDQANGDRNDDIVEGGPGNDLLKGNKGDDRIAGGTGVDIISGGGGGGDSCSDGDLGTSFSNCENP